MPTSDEVAPKDRSKADADLAGDPEPWELFQSSGPSDKVSNKEAMPQHPCSCNVEMLGHTDPSYSDVLQTRSATPLTSKCSCSITKASNNNRPVVAKTGCQAIKPPS